MSEINKRLKKNVLGGALASCCLAPKTGFFRDGYCRTDDNDHGRHVICAEMTTSFLQFSQEHGNDLSTPKPEFDFPGLKPGDRWCLCALRWKEAWEAGVAPPVILESCEETALKIIALDILQQYAIKAVH